MIFYDKQHFNANDFDGGAYCDFSSAAASAMAGKDILLAIWKLDGSAILAVAGQQGLTINRSADTIEVSTKDTEGGWKASIAGMKEWSIDLDGLYVKDDASQAVLSTAFENSDLICIKVYDAKASKGLFGGLAVITDFPIEAPYDDAVTYSVSFSGNGPLTDLSVHTPSTDTLPT